MVEVMAVVEQRCCWAKIPKLPAPPFVLLFLFSLFVSSSTSSTPTPLSLSTSEGLYHPQIHHSPTRICAIFLPFSVPLSPLFAFSSFATLFFITNLCDLCLSNCNPYFYHLKIQPIQVFSSYLLLELAFSHFNLLDPHLVAPRLSDFLSPQI